MKLDSMELGLLRTNCYLLWDEQTLDAVVLDPGYPDKRLTDRVLTLGVTLRAVVLTHGHFDHVGGVAALTKAFGCKAYLPAPDTSLPEKITGGALTYTDLYSGGQTLQFGSISMTAIATPGHTPGSSCLRVGRWLFTGDTLFRDACGRTDLDGGDWRTMRRSLAVLARLDGDFYVYPGHGDATTLERERTCNAYLMEAVRR